MNGCPILAKKEYLDRHNKVYAMLHFNLSKHYNCKRDTERHQHNPKKVTSSTVNKITILYNHPNI